MAFDIEMIKSVYDGIGERVVAVRKIVSQPLTLIEKILYAHLAQGSADQKHERGKSYV